MTPEWIESGATYGVTVLGHAEDWFNLTHCKFDFLPPSGLRVAFCKQRRRHMERQRGDIVKVALELRIEYAIGIKSGNFLFVRMCKNPEILTCDTFGQHGCIRVDSELGPARSTTRSS
jgi:hypothetical protein